MGVEVGYTTLISGDGELVTGKGPVRTGVTGILPRGIASCNDPVAAETMTGAANRTVIELPHARLKEVLKKYNRLGGSKLEVREKDR